MRCEGTERPAAARWVVDPQVVATEAGIRFGAGRLGSLAFHG